MVSICLIWIPLAPSGYVWSASRPPGIWIYLFNSIRLPNAAYGYSTARAANTTYGGC